MSPKTRFGYAPIEQQSPFPRQDRWSPGPLGLAVRDAAEAKAAATGAKVEHRRRTAKDAKAFRAAQDDGLLLLRVPLDQIATDDLPRDRIALDAVASSDEMKELKASIRDRGQKEPIEIYRGADGGYQLKKGWRRLTALRQLLAETGEARFGEVIARVETGEGDRVLRYLDMVEENVVREDLTFAEMAQVAITAARDPHVAETDPAELVSQLYSALHKTKRSYVRSFVFLLVALGDGLRWPKAVPRNLGVDVARAITSPDQADALAAKLAACASAERQNAVLAAFVAKQGKAAKKAAARSAASKQKLEFCVGETNVTAGKGELRLMTDRDFASAPKGLLEDAVKAFNEVINRLPRIR